MKIKRKKVIVILLIITSLLIFLFINHREADKTMGFQVNIPEIENSNIIKNIEYENDSIIMETILIIKDPSNISFYTLFKIRNVKNNFTDIIQNQVSDNFNGIWVSSLNPKELLIRNLYPNAKSLDFKYKYNVPPIEKKLLSDSVYFQKFENTKIKISLTHENKKDLCIKMAKPFIMIFYKKEEDLFLILAEKKQNKTEKWVTQEELEKTLYPLVKNWGVYEKR